MSAPFTITFQVNCETSLGDYVVVVGDVPELGGWHVNSATALTTSPASYPLWQATVSLPSASLIQYKYIIYHTDGSYRWEEGNNRCARARGGLPCCPERLGRCPLAPRPRASQAPQHHTG